MGDPEMIEGYRVNSFGAIEQINPGPGPVYDAEYVRSRYDNNPKTEALSVLRTMLLSRYCSPHWDVDGQPVGIVDFGCGNWTFVKIAKSTFKGTPIYGRDISDYPVPECCECDSVFTKRDTLTCFDSLEHLSFEAAETMLYSSKLRYVMLSLPWCHARILGKHWFETWKHRRPNEHLFHLDHLSLTELMHGLGYKTLFLGNPEDVIREPIDHRPNILTGIFHRP